jgi:CheY-like chemotaxis protein
MPRVLLVEDNEMNRDMLARRLQKRGFEVSFAITGAEGVSKALADGPDLVLMDMNLPEVDGWEATRRLRADPAGRALRIIALTAHAMEGDRQRSLAAGCDDYETKPVDIERLVKKMNALLAGARAPGAAGPVEGA